MPPAPTAPVPQLRAMSADLVEQCAERPEIDGQAVAAAVNDLGGWKSEAETATKRRVRMSTRAHMHFAPQSTFSPLAHCASVDKRHSGSAHAAETDRGTLACRRKCASAAWPSRPPCSDRNQPIECDQTHPTTRSEKKHRKKQQQKKKQRKRRTRRNSQIPRVDTNAQSHTALQRIHPHSCTAQRSAAHVGVAVRGVAPQA